jgi:hypothetical protein
MRVYFKMLWYTMLFILATTGQNWNQSIRSTSQAAWGFSLPESAVDFCVGEHEGFLACWLISSCIDNTVIQVLVPTLQGGLMFTGIGG